MIFLSVETRLALPATSNPFDGYDVFKLQFETGELDMVVCDNAKRKCWLFEIKHSGETAEAQMRHLLDEKKAGFVRERYGEIVVRAVLYRGADVDLPSGISYRNVNEYLKNVSSFYRVSGNPLP